MWCTVCWVYRGLQHWLHVMHNWDLLIVSRPLWLRMPYLILLPWHFWLHLQGLVDSLLLSACDARCKTCIGPANTQCPTCSDGNYLQPSSTTCLPTCPTKYYKTNNNLCLPCHAYCAECTGPLNTECTSCVTPNVYAVSATYCDVVCPVGRYKDNNSWTCPGKCCSPLPRL